MQTIQTRIQAAGYSALQIGLHWAIVVLVVANWLLAGGMRPARGAEAAAATGTPLHVIVGVVILGLMLVRLALRLLRPVAEAPAPNKAMGRAATAVHWLLYALLLAMPVTGLMAWALGIRDAGDIHETLWTALMLTALLHVAAAMFHQFVLRDRLMLRMTRAS